MATARHPGIDHRHTSITEDLREVSQRGTTLAHNRTP